MDLDQVLPDVLNLARPLAARHGVRLDSTPADGLPSLAVHQIALSQALLNLLSVAIRRAAGGVVLVSARALGPEVEIEVSCSAPRPRQETSAGDDATSLDLADQLAALCKGQLVVSNERDLFQAALTIPATEQLPVLVIDDNADTLQLLQRYTADTHYRLITTPHPEQALALAERFAPHIIVLDVMMPRLDGWKVLAQLRQHPLTSQIPIVVCTIMAQEEMALALGASGFVRKPVTRQAFLVALDQQIRRPEPH